MPNQIDSFYRKILDDKGIKVDLEKSLWIDYVFNAKTLDYISVKMNKRKSTVKKMLRRYKIPMNPKWSFGKIMEGFEAFYQKNGHYPTATEIDYFPGLPSARQIQRIYGGVKEFRKLINLDITDYGRGDFRSNIASSVGKRGFKGEVEIEKLLIQRFGEICVHPEKRLSNRQRIDFFIYANAMSFGIDVFYSIYKEDIQKNINNKMVTYKDILFDSYFVCLNGSVSQELLDLLVKNKKNLLPKNIRVFSYKGFLKFIKIIEPLHLNTSYVSIDSKNN